MSVKVAAIVIIVFGIAVIIAAYIQRGCWAVGPEWIMPIIAAGMCHLKNMIIKEKHLLKDVEVRRCKPKNLFIG